MSNRKVHKVSGPSGGGVDGSSNRQIVKDVVQAILDRKGEVASGLVAKATGLSRQTAHAHLTAMTREGVLEAVGSGRAARYRRRHSFDRTYSAEALAEDEVWDDVIAGSDVIGGLPENVLSILRYATTEMINNAIEHSGSPTVRVWVQELAEVVGFGVSDRGVGAFARVREALGLEDEFEALQHLTKGKVTTDPEHHTGEGIFFTSKVLDVFALESNGLRWTVDNRRADQAAGEAAGEPGTRVAGEISVRSDRRIAEVFGAYTEGEDLSFSKTRVTVRLIATNTRFVSRSEAKRLSLGLEKFEEVLVDFAGVAEVGQGFVDEIFRVWASQHPETRIVPMNTDPAVRAMIERGLPRR